MNRARSLLLIGNGKAPVRFLASCALRDSLALKWFCPAERAIILPFLVTLTRFMYDLFVFIRMMLQERILY